MSDLSIWCFTWCWCFMWCAGGVLFARIWTEILVDEDGPKVPEWILYFLLVISGPVLWLVFWIVNYNKRKKDDGEKE